MKGNLYWEMPALNYADIDNNSLEKYFFNENNISAKESKKIF